MKNLIFCSFVFLFSPAHAQIITTTAGSGTAGYSPDGSIAVSANLIPASVAIDASGTVYFSEIGRVRKFDGTGAIVTVAGTGGLGDFGDGGPATSAQFSTPQRIRFDGAGNLYILDRFHGRIRKVNTAGIISTIAGTGVPGYSGDGGPATAAQIEGGGFGFAVDIAGNVYLGDSRIRKVDLSGTITAIAGNGGGGYSGDGGPATAAQISSIEGLGLDIAGNVYFTDARGARKINTSGIITRIASDTLAVFGFSGDGGPATAARFNYAYSIAADASGNVYISDVQNGRIRRIDAAGIIKTYAGNGYLAGPGTGSYSGDHCAATDAALWNPGDLAMDASGNIFFNGNDHRIRKISAGHTPAFSGGRSQHLGICHGTVSVSINSLLAVNDSDVLQPEVWSLVTPPVHGTAVVSYSVTSTGSPLTPTGLSYTPVVGYVGLDSFRVRSWDCGHVSDTSTIFVSIDTTPVSGTITGTDSLCPGKSLSLANAASGGLWSTTNTHATIGSATGIVSGITTGIDTVLYIVTNACGADTAKFPLKVHTLAECYVSAPGTSGTVAVLSVQPNPNPGTFTMSLSSPVDEPIQVNITNMLGRVITNFTTATNTPNTVNLQAPPGIYLLTAAGSSRYTARVVVQ